MGERVDWTCPVCFCVGREQTGHVESAGPGGESGLDMPSLMPRRCGGGSRLYMPSLLGAGKERTGHAQSAAQGVGVGEQIVHAESAGCGVGGVGAGMGKQTGHAQSAAIVCVFFR